jgi:hypothetical protein
VTGKFTANIEIAGPFKIESEPVAMTVGILPGASRQRGLASQLEAKKPVASWNFDEGDGDTVRDSTGENNGVIHGATWTNGKTGKALSFDGQNSYVVVLDNSSICVGGGDYTISAWICPKCVSDKYGIVAKVKDSGNKEYAFGLEGGALTLDVEKEHNNGKESTGPAVVADTWQHVVVVFDSKARNAAFYVDNKLQKVIGDTLNALPIYFDDDLYIGKWGGKYDERHFDGAIDSVQIYDYALNADEVAALYAGKEIGRRGNFVPVLVVVLIAVAAVVLTRRKKKPIDR